MYSIQAKKFGIQDCCTTGKTEVHEHRCVQLQKYKMETKSLKILVGIFDEHEKYMQFAGISYESFTHRLFGNCFLF